MSSLILPTKVSLCDPSALKKDWDKASLQKGWHEKIHEWISFGNAPVYGKKQNYCELTGVMLLIPCSLGLGIFLIKHPKNVNVFNLMLKKMGAVFLLIVTLPLTILGILFKGCGAIFPHEKIECDDSTKKSTHPLISEACYLMTEKFASACQELNFQRFYPIAGTLLGAVRHRGFIPWDDDVDLGFDIADIDLLTTQLKPLLEAAGVVWSDNLYESFSVIKLSFNQKEWNKLIENYQRKNPSDPIPQDLISESPNIIDLCGNTIMSDGSWASASSAGRVLFPTDYIPLKNKNEIKKPQQYIQFGNSQLPTFSNETIIYYLKTYYGNDCLDYGIQTHSHGSLNTCCGRIPLPKFHPTYRFKINSTLLHNFIV